MSKRHEKNVQRKERAKERSNAIARSLRSQPLRLINTCGLQTLQRALGLPLGPYPCLGEQAQDSSSSERKDEEGTRVALSNVSDAPSSEIDIVPISDRSIPNPQEPEFLDAIFIAIDFEYSHYSPKTGRIRLREVGISMLDTRDLGHQNVHPKDVISTQHYRTVTDTKKFLFGETVDTLQEELILILKRLLYIEDELPEQLRDIILVGHGLSFEIKVMKGLRIDLNLATSVIEIFDTEFLGYEVFGKDFKCSLSNVVRKIGVSGGLFTTQAMMLILVFGL